MSSKKIWLGILGIVAAGGIGFAYVRHKNKQADTIDPQLNPSSPDFTPVAPKTKTQSQPAALNYDTPFTAADKAHVQIMQKMIGVVPDGAWGAKTEAALPKGLPRPFTLNQLQAKINALNLEKTRSANVKKTGLKVGDYVYAAYTTDVEVTKGAKYKNLKWVTTGAKRKQEVSQGQLLGKIVVLNPSSVLILNAYQELVLTSYAQVSKTRSVNGLDL